MLFSSILLALALATPDAHAAKVKSGRIIQNTTTNAGDIVVVTTDDGTGTVANVGATIESPDGTETVRLAASDAWLHGSALLTALPATDARVSLTVYDTASAALVTFSSVLSPTLGWSGWDTTVHENDVLDGDGRPVVPDVGLLAAPVFATDDGSVLAFDLNGADTLAVAYADITITETIPCVTRGCLGDTTTTRRTVEVDLDDAGIVWQGAVGVALDGVSDVTIATTDASGAALETVRTQVVRAWDDGGAGVSALPTDEDPLTSVALLDWNQQAQFQGDGTWHAGPTSALTVASAGWALDDTLPTYAEITLGGGEVWNVPANSYQRAASAPIPFRGDPAAEKFAVTVNGVRFDAANPLGARGLCQHGTCVALSQDTDGAWTLSATAYAATPDALPEGVTVSLAGVYGAATPSQSSYALAFDEEVAVVFATEVGFAGDPAGLDLTGRVRLRGKQTLLVGKFAGVFGVDSEGHLDLAVVGSGGATVSRGDILIGGEPIDFERTDIDGDGVISAPPVVMMKDGTGTRNTTPNSSQSQQAQLL